MKVFSSHNLDILFNEFAKDFLGVTYDPFYTEKILIQTEGIEKWLSMKIASDSKIGVFANIEFLYPRELITSILHEAGLYSQEENYKIINTFLISEFLLKEPKIYPSKSHFELYNISSYLSDILEQYAIYRPKLFDAWDENKRISESEEEAIQKSVYEYIKSKNPQKPLSRIITEFLKNKKFETVKDKFRRVFVFGVSTLPPIFLNFLMRLKDVIEVKFYLKTPSEIGEGAPNRWIDPDIASEKTTKKIKACSGDIEKQHFTKGNPLLLNNAKTAKDFFELIADYVDSIEEDIPNPDEKEDILLNNVKRDILYNNFPEPQKKSVDESIQIHSAHTPPREVEILYHNILDFFDKDSSLKSNDIIVMTPDINKYAHYIRNVFDNAEHKIPYSIADESDDLSKSDSRVLLKLLNVKKSRFTFSWVMDLLGEISIRTKFDISEKDILIIKKIFGRLNTAWGIDEEQKGLFDIPKDQWENTWRSSIENILLAYCKDDPDFKAIVGDLFNLSHTEILGKFLNFFEAIVLFHRATQEPNTLKAWGEMLKEHLFKIQEFQHKKFESKLRRKIQILSVNETLKVDFEYVVSYLQDFLSKMKDSHLFLNGGVTFCEMLPMRSIPHKIVCLLGMNESEYPRSNFDKSLNLMAEKPEKGDRDIRQYDRYLFLESIISAQNIFYISYIGQDIKSNERIPPSLLVSELLSYLKRFYLIDEKDIVINHPLHSFDKRYFMDAKLKNYSMEDFHLSKTNSTNSVCDQIPHSDSESSKEINLEEMIQFYTNPIKYFYKNVAGIHLDNILKNNPDSEILKPEIDYYKQDMLLNFLFNFLLKTPEALQKEKKDEVFEKIKRMGVLPIKSAGKYLFEEYLNRLGKMLSDLEVKRSITVEIKKNGVSGFVFTNEENAFYIPTLIKNKPNPNQKIKEVITASAISIEQKKDVNVVHFDDKIKMNKMLLEQAKVFFENFVSVCNSMRSQLIVLDPEMVFKKDFEISKDFILKSILERINNPYRTPDIYKNFFVQKQHIDLVDLEENKKFYQEVYSEDLKKVLK